VGGDDILILGIGMLLLRALWSLYCQYSLCLLRSHEALSCLNGKFKED
jgi:hypothetical protein